MKTLTDFAVSHWLGIAVIVGYIYAVILIVVALIRDGQEGSWVLVKAIGIFAAVGFCNLLLAIFLPGQLPSFN
jgi:hypothetical protein